MKVQFRIDNPGSECCRGRGEEGRGRTGVGALGRREMEREVHGKYSPGLVCILHTELSMKVSKTGHSDSAVGP